MFNPAGQVKLIIISQERVISAVAGIKCTPVAGIKCTPFTGIKCTPIAGIKCTPVHIIDIRAFAGWYRGICWKLNVVWHCKSHLGMEKRRRWPPSRSPPSAATKIPSSCDLLMFPKDRWDLLSLIVDVWNITWSRRYLITIFAEHCVKIHDSWYFPGILDHVSNIDIDIDIDTDKFSQCDLF